MYGAVPWYKIPSSLCFIRLFIPPTSAATTGVPINIASPMEFEEFSMLDEQTKTFARRYSLTIDSSSNLPSHSIFSSNLLFLFQLPYADSSVRLADIQHGLNKVLTIQTEYPCDTDNEILLQRLADCQLTFQFRLAVYIPPPLIRRKNSNRVEYNFHF